MMRGKPFFVVVSHTLRYACVCSLHLHSWHLPRHKPSGFVPEKGFPRAPFQESHTGFLWTILICLRASEARGTLWGLFSPKPRTRVIDPEEIYGRDILCGQRIPLPCPPQESRTGYF